MLSGRAHEAEREPRLDAARDPDRPMQQGCEIKRARMAVDRVDLEIERLLLEREVGVLAPALRDPPDQALHAADAVALDEDEPHHQDEARHDADNGPADQRIIRLQPRQQDDPEHGVAELPHHLERHVDDGRGGGGGAGDPQQRRGARAHDEAAELRQRQDLRAGIADQPPPDEGRERRRARRQQIPAETEQRHAREVQRDDRQEPRPAHRQQRMPDFGEAEISDQRRSPAADRRSPAGW